MLHYRMDRKMYDEGMKNNNILEQLFDIYLYTILQIRVSLTEITRTSGTHRSHECSLVLKDRLTKN